MFSSTSSAEWTKVSEGVTGSAYYLDLDRIRKNDGYVYYWKLQDYLKPDKYGDLSDKFYVEGDCKRFRRRWLSSISYKQPMGEGTAGNSASNSNPEWTYPSPDSVSELLLNRVCAQ